MVYMYNYVHADVRSIDKTPPLINASGHKDVVQYLVEKANCDISEYTHPIISLVLTVCLSLPCS